MLIGIISDPHANLFALEAVLDDVDAVRPDVLICLGDFISYGAQPNEVVQMLKGRCKVSLAGNHDLAVLGSRLVPPRMNEMATAAVEWTRDRLNADSRSFLSQLPSEGQIEGIAVAHASLRDPISEYVLDVATANANFNERDFDVAFVGHTHVPAAFWIASDSNRVEASRLTVGARDEVEFPFESKGRVLLNPGSVGQPRDGDPRASWATWDPSRRAMTLRRVDYPIAYEQESIRKAGLPEKLAIRLADGL